MDDNFTTYYGVVTASGIAPGNFGKSTAPVEVIDVHKEIQLLASLLVDKYLEDVNNGSIKKLN